MASKEMDQFELVSSQRDRERILAEIAVKGTIAIVHTDDQHSFVFRVVNSIAPKLTLELHGPQAASSPQATRSVKRGETVDLLVGLNDGQYLMRVPVSQVIEPSIVLELTGDIHRLQRRANFRTVVPANERVFYRLKAAAGGKVVDLPVVDLSAGGMRVRWPATGSPSPTPNSEWVGELHLTDGRKLETHAVVRNLFPTEGTAYALVGMEFRGLAARDQQSLVFVCMQMFRSVANRGKS